MDVHEPFFIDDNILNTSEERSPSGRFSLKIITYKTKEGCWNYTKGILSNESSKIAEVYRNYSTFHHSFFNKDNHEWIQTGSTYMSQTFINLDTGEVFDNSEKLKQTEAYKKGYCFCWCRSKVSPDGKTIAVSGCYWGASYEIKFFDLSDMNNIVELDCSEDIYDDDLDFNWNPDGTFTCIHYREFSRSLGKFFDEFSSDDEIPEDEDDFEKLVHLAQTFERNGNKMELVPSSLRESE